MLSPAVGRLTRNQRRGDPLVLAEGNRNALGGVPKNEPRDWFGSRVTGG